MPGHGAAGGVPAAADHSRARSRARPTAAFKDRSSTPHSAASTCHRSCSYADRLLPPARCGCAAPPKLRRPAVGGSQGEGRRWAARPLRWLAQEVAACRSPGQTLPSACSPCAPLALAWSRSRRSRLAIRCGLKLACCRRRCCCHTYRHLQCTSAPPPPPPTPAYLQLPTDVKLNYFDAEGNMQEVAVGSLTKGKKVCDAGAVGKGCVGMQRQAECGRSPLRIAAVGLV